MTRILAVAQIAPMSGYHHVYDELKQRIAHEPHRLDDWLGQRRALRRALSAMQREGRMSTASYRWMTLILDLCEDISQRQQARTTSRADGT